MVHRTGLTVQYIIIFFIGFALLSQPVKGQEVSGTLKYPWTGGLNSCQFGKMDLNLDGILDLVIFDRHGNRIIPLLNNGQPGLDGYSYHPEFIKNFPDLHDWVVFADYDCDGKTDLFTYSIGGARVFRNISDTVLKFQLVTDLLQSFYYTGKTFIFISSIEYPAIVDIDNDGDLDILTFAALGSYIEYHKNLSKENNWHCDSLDFRLADHCWGDIKQSQGSNLITLNVTCPYKESGILQSGIPEKGGKHIGSTFLALDLDNNGTKDLVIGDFDFPNLKALTNGGTPDSAHITSQDTTFPSGTRPANLYSFPAAFFIDIDNDGINDLILSPFDPSLTTSENFRSIWFYKNTRSNSNPDFQFMTDRLFLDQMIDVGSNSYPVLFDIDGDGLTDLIIGNYGYYDSSWYSEGTLHSSFTSKLSFYKNIGSQTNPVFQLQTTDFANISRYHLLGCYPAFGDVDGDGDADLIVGNSDGTLLYFENVAGSGKLPEYASPVMNYQGIDVGEYSTPQLFDLDKDGLLDLIIGEKAGNLNYYHHSGSITQPAFTFVTDSLGKVNVTNYNLSYDGYSTPCFTRDQTGKSSLVVGCEEGKVHYYTDIDQDILGKYTSSDSILGDVIGTPLQISYGQRTAACLSYFTGNSYPDLVVGNFSGGLNYFSHYSSPDVISSLPDHTNLQRKLFKIFPNPADHEFTIKLLSSNGAKTEKIIISDLPGQILFTSDFHQKITIPADPFKNGLYLIKIGNWVEKLLILHH